MERDTMAVANEYTNRYQSFPMGGDASAEDVLRLFTEDVEFAGPFTLVEEYTTYTPGDDFNSHSIDPKRQVVVYDSYGPHGVIRPEPVFDFLVEVREWIDATLESEAEGEYVIGQVIGVEDLV